MSGIGFHTPDDLERSFLQVLTFGYPELQAQVNNCEVDDYDPNGYCDVRVIEGPRSPIKSMCDGPSLRDRPDLPPVETLLWINDGFLDSIEFVGYGAPLDDIYRRFVEAGKASKLLYKHEAP